jgi:(p)ppGpp synthase/HD superfamily hydrolase
MTFNSIPGERFANAFTFAARVHGTQVRKQTTIPYTSHLVAVSSRVMEYGGDEDQAIAGLLHDVIEDCGAEHEVTIREHFGDRVAMIVRACTDDDVQPKPPWVERKKAYLAHLTQAPADVLLDSACDKLHNARAILADLRAIGPAVFERFKPTPAQTLWHYRSLADTFTPCLPGELAEELDRTVSTIEALAGSD